MPPRVCLFLVWWLWAWPVHAATYYVATTGDNARSCATASVIGTPKLTVVNGITCLSAGDTLLVRAGTYAEAISTVPSGTSWANTVRVANYPGETVWLAPTTGVGGNDVIWLDGAFQYIEFDGINVDGTVMATKGQPIWFSTNNSNNPHHIRFQNAEVIAGAQGGGGAIALGGHTLIGATGGHEIINVTIHGGGLPGLCGFECASYGVYIEGPNMLVENCNIYDTSGAFIQIYNAAGDPPDNAIIRNNRLHTLTDMGDATQVYGIIVSGADDTQIYNNIISGIAIGNVGGGNAAIAIGGSSLRTIVWNNTIADNRSYGVLIDAGSNNGQVRNTISYANGTNVITDNATGTTKDHNLDDGTNPLFVNAAGEDYRLQSTSPARDTGATIATVTDDFAGTPRPQGLIYDIGAYEFFGGVTPAGNRVRVRSVNP